MPDVLSGTVAELGEGFIVLSGGIRITVSSRESASHHIVESYEVHCGLFMCKTWIGYVTTEDGGRSLGQTHLSDAESSRPLIHRDGAHVLTVRPDLFWTSR